MKDKKPWFKRWYIWVGALVVLSLVIYPFLPDNEEPPEDAAYVAAVVAPSPEPAPTPTPEPDDVEEPDDDAQDDEPEPTATPEPTPAPVGYIISAPDEGRRNQNLTITFQGEPDTQYALTVFSAAGNQLTAAGLGSTTSNADGVASWTWQVGGQTGAGTQRATITGGGVTVRHEIRIIVD